MSHLVTIRSLLLGFSLSLAVSVPVVNCCPYPHLLCFIPAYVCSISVHSNLHFQSPSSVAHTHTQFFLSIFFFFFFFPILILLLLFCSYYYYYISFSLSSTFSFKSIIYLPSFFFFLLVFLLFLLLLLITNYRDECNTLFGIPYNPGGLCSKFITTEVTPFHPMKFNSSQSFPLFI